MLNHLTSKIRQKQLYFTNKSFSLKSLNKLNLLLVHNIISGFYIRSKKKKTFVMAFINYSYNFESIIETISNSTKNNINIDNKSLDTNFVLNVDIKTNKKLKNKIKFR